MSTIMYTQPLSPPRDYSIPWSPQKIFSHTQGQLSVSMNVDQVNATNNSAINNSKIKTKTPKGSNSKNNGGQIY